MLTDRNKFTKSEDDVRKLSEEIVLGSTLIKFNPEFYLGLDYSNPKPQLCGCLIGMAAVSMGKTISDIIFYGKFIFPEYPWLFQKFKSPEGVEYVQNYPYPAFMIIGQMARQIKLGTYTFEQALAWIRSVEPEEEYLPDYVEEFLGSPAGERNV